MVDFTFLFWRHLAAYLEQRISAKSAPLPLNPFLAAFFHLELIATQPPLATHLILSLLHHVH